MQVARGRHDERMFYNQTSVIDGFVLRIAEKIRRREVIFFLGAGASCDAPAGLPTSFSLLDASFARIALPSAGRSKEQMAARIVKQIRFEVFMQTLVTAVGQEAVGALRILNAGRPNVTHNFVALLAEHNLAPFVLTTNFDSLLEQALVARHCGDFELWHLNSHWRRSPTVGSRFKVLKLHGSLRDKTGQPAGGSILIATSQVGRSMPHAKAKILRDVLRGYHLVFVGYSGLDDFDLLPLLLTTPSDREIFWISHGSGSEVSTASSLRKHPHGTIGNPERIVSSREEGVVVRCNTRRFLSLLSEELFGDGFGRAPRSNQGYDFGYLDAWEARTELQRHKPFINGVLSQRMDDHTAAIDFFHRVPTDAPEWKDAAYYAAVSLRHQGSIDAARTQLTQLVNTRAAPLKEVRAKALIQLGLLENEQANLPLGRGYLRKAMRILPEDAAILVAGNNNLGMSSLFEAERLHQAGESHTEVVKSARQAFGYLSVARTHVGSYGNPLMAANICGNLGLSCVFLCRFKRATVYFAEALRLFRSLHLASEEASCLGNLGYYYKAHAMHLGCGNSNYNALPEEALKCNKQAHAIKQRVSTPRRVAFSRHEIGDVYRLLGRKGQALHWLKSARAILEGEGLEGYCADITKVIDQLRGN